MTKKVIIIDDDQKKRACITEAVRAIAQNVGSGIEIIPFTHVEPFLDYISKQPEEVVAVCADNNMYGKYRGVEMLTAASKALPNVGVFWSSSDKPNDDEQKALAAAGVNYAVACGLLSGEDAAELIEGGRNTDGTLPDYLKRHEGLFVLQDTLGAAKSSALDLARREGEVRTPLAQATRPSDGTLGVGKK